MRWFARNLRTLGLAIVLGFSVWVSAVTAADPDEVRAPLRIRLDIIGQESSLVITNDIPDFVQVTLRAPRSVWEQISTQEDAVRAILDLSGLSAGDHNLPIQIPISVRPVQLVLADPSSVSVVLEPLKVRTLPISLSLSGQPAIGYQAGDATIDPTEVILSGPESLVNQAERARVLVKLDGLREGIEESMDIEILDTEGAALEGVTANPATALVSIPISQQGGFREVAVKVIIRGQVAAGYRLENISVFPPVVTVFSEDPELVNELPGVVETQPLEMQNAKQDIATRLALDLPAGVTIVGAQSQTVQVQVAISPIQTSITLLNQPISVVGLPEGLIAQISPDTVDVIISGPLPVLEALTPQDITVIVDVTGLNAGIHQIVPKSQVLVENVLVESILPSTMEVILMVPPTPTRTPGP